MEVTLTEPFGALVGGVDLAAGVDAATTEVLRDVLAAHGVVVFPDQAAIDDADLTAFLEAFGPLLGSVWAAPPGDFAVDGGYQSAPASYSALRVDARSGRRRETHFSDQWRAAATLPESLRARVEGRALTHVARRGGRCAEEVHSAAHPLLRAHPRTRVPVLYLDATDRCAHISGLEATEVPPLVAELMAHSTGDQLLLRHRWAPGDVVMWDNARVLHRGVGTCERACWRGAVTAAGYGV